MVRQTRNIPQGKESLVSEEEKQQAYDYQNNTDALYHAGINVGKPGFYNPEAGHDKVRNERPESEPTPLLATDPGQPKGIGADLVERERNKAVDKSEAIVVRSGRKRATTQESTDGEASGTGESQ